MSAPGAITTTGRVRWAAIGAAVAVSVGAGGLGRAQAAPPDEPSDEVNEAVSAFSSAIRMICARLGSVSVEKTTSSWGSGSAMVFLSFR